MTRSLVIASTFVAEPIRPVLEYWGRQLGTSLSLAFAPYAQIVQQLLDDNSALSTNRDGNNVLLVRCEDWLGKLAASDAEIAEIAERVRHASDDLVEAMRVAAMRSSSAGATIVCLCPASGESRRGQLETAEDALASRLAALPRTTVVRHREIEALYPVATIYDRVADTAGHVPYTTDYYTAVGTYLSRVIAAAHRPPIKVLVVDCDNTLWRGVCGEVGPLGVEVDRGSAELQQFLLAQSQTGAVLCLSSKNAESDVWDVFEHNRGMIVKRSDVVASRIDWRPKSEHLTELARELNLGIESFAFIDDSPIECAEVQAARPTVMVLELPPDRAQIGELLRHTWELDRFASTAEDRERTRMYQQESQREQIRREALTLDEFLDKMAIEVTVRVAEVADVPRIVQMTKRTNQFNTTTLRESDSAVERWLVDHTRSSFVVHVRDRFGDYGLVGVVGVDWRAEAGVVDRLLLSCRVLGRHVEHRVLQHLGTVAIDRGVSSLAIRFVATAKNEPARAFLDSLGCDVTTDADGHVTYALSSSSATQARASRQVPGRSIEASKAAPEVVEVTRPQVATRLRSVAEIRAAMQTTSARPLAQPLVGPTNDLERLLTAHWARALELDAVGIDDDLFELGASSITFVIASSSLSDALDVEIPVSVLLDVSTIAGQATALREARLA